MMHCYNFALTANAGLSITFPSSICWIDALHAIKAPSYSSVTPELWEAIQQDPAYVGADHSGPDAICFSHCHIDHFSANIVRDAIQKWPEAKVILPEKYFDKEIYVSGSEMYVDVHDTQLHYIRTHHSTHRHHHKTHYSLMISDHGHNIYMPMDSSMSDPDTLRWGAETDIDVAIVDFIWLILDKGRDIIENIIKPKHLLVYHLQFEPDDFWNYRSQTHEAAKLLTSIPDVRIFDTPLQKEQILL